MASQSWFKNIDNPALKDSSNPILKPSSSNISRPNPIDALLSRPTFNPVSRQKAQSSSKILKIPKPSVKKQVSKIADLIADVKVDNVYRSKLSSEQLMILNKVLEGQNVFFTGYAGSGKSYLLRQIIKELKVFNAAVLGVTASTGLAAHNIQGMSLHSLAGVGLGNQTVDQMVMICKRTKQILVIDEVSMVHASYFDKLEELARRIRGNDLAFGGIQIVLCGDFMQLPPPTNNAKFIFESNAWNSLQLSTYQLTQVFRQNDTTLIQILNEVRNGKLSHESCQLLSSLSRTPTSFKYLTPTALFALKREAETVNFRELDRLLGREVVYPSLDFFSNGLPVTDSMKKKLDDSLLTVGELKLKIGAQVMVIKNLPNFNLYNGQVGKVVKLEPDKIYIEIGIESSKRVVLLQREEFTLSSSDSSSSTIRKQFPIVLSYAMSIHKAQGQTIRHLQVDFKSIFETGQAYVALSRCVSLENLQVLNFSVDKVKVNPKIVEFHKKLRFL